MTIEQRPRILIVEDDLDLAQWTKDYLSAKGFEVSLAANGQSAIEQVRDNLPDLVILDGMLPDIDGLDVCKTVRTFYHNPIIMLTARDEEIDEVLGLEMGADDYLTKPIRARALLARIRGQLRRFEGSEHLQSQSHDQSTLTIDGLEIDKQSRTVRLNNESVGVTSNEFDVLWFLASRAGQIVTRESLVSQLRGFDYDGFDRSIDLRISGLRKKLEDDPSEPYRIKTVWGKGYILTKDSWK